MNFSIDWQRSGDSRAPEIAATTGAWRIDVGATNISKFAFLERDEAPERIITSCYPIAEGLLRSWWYLFSSRSGSLSLRAFREGFVFPDLVLIPTGSAIEVVARRIDYSNPKVSFLNEATERLSVSDAQSVIGDFIELTIGQLRKANVASTFLEQRWQQIAISISDLEEQEFCIAAGAAGLDPYNCSESEVKSIFDAARIFDGDHLIEFLSGERPERGKGSTDKNISSDLNWIGRAREQVGALASLPEVMAFAGRVAEPVIHRTPYRLGYLAAAQLREALGLHDEQGVSSVSEMASLMGNPSFQASNLPALHLRGLVEYQTGNVPRVFIPLFHREDSKAFALARGIGDIIMYPNDGCAPITESHSERQAAGRAFAAEFLAPAKALIERRDDGWSAEELAREFGVGEFVINYQLKNAAPMYSD